jgi:hypothetical protein
MSQRSLTRLVLPLVCLGISVPLFGQAPAPANRQTDVPVERPRAQTGAQTLEQAPVQIRTGARVRIGDDVTIPEGVVATDVVAVFGDIELNGTAEGNVVAVFGDVVVGPRAQVRGDVAAIGGRVVGAEGASIWGSLTQLGWSMPDIRFTLGDRNLTTVEVVPDWPRIARVQWWVALVGTSFFALAFALTVMGAPRAIDAGIQGSRPLLTAWLVGMLVQMLGLPLLVALSVVLVATVIGIPLLAAVPILLLGLLAMSIVGAAAFAVRLGNLFLPEAFRSNPSVIALSVGLLALTGPALAGSYLWTTSNGTSILALALIALGTFVEYTWWTIGTGAAVVAWWRRRRLQRKARRSGSGTPAPIDPSAPLDSLPLPSGI